MGCWTRKDTIENGESLLASYVGSTVWEPAGDFTHLVHRKGRAMGQARARLGLGVDEN